jgi:hypothetical protein
MLKCIVFASRSEYLGLFSDGVPNLAKGEK